MSKDPNQAHLEVWFVDVRGSREPLTRDDGQGGSTHEYQAAEAGRYAAAQAFKHQPWKPGLAKIDLLEFDPKGRLIRKDTREFDDEGQELKSYSETFDPDASS